MVGYQDHVPSSKTEPPTSTADEIENTDKAGGSAAPVNNGAAEEIPVTVSFETAQTTALKRPPAGSLRRMDASYSIAEGHGEEARVKIPNKTPSKCVTEMQQHVRFFQ